MNIGDKLGMGEDWHPVAGIRLLLDFAKDTYEAVHLLSQYDIFPSVNSVNHLAVSDRHDNNVVVELKNGVMNITDTDVTPADRQL